MIHTIPVLKDNYAYIMEGCDKQCLIIDPGESAPILSFLKNHDLKPVLILNTHHHGDHTAGNKGLAAAYNIPIHGPEKERSHIPDMAKGLKDGNIITEGGLELTVMETPGHTTGHIVFYSAALQALFSGDTLFSLGCGRLMEGTPEDMFSSLQKLKYLPAQTRIYCGHEYTLENTRFASSLGPENPALKNKMEEVRRLRSMNEPTIPSLLGEELNLNPFLRAKTLEEFTALRSKKDRF